MENDSSREDEVKASASGFKTISRLLVEIKKKVNTEILPLTEGKYKHTHIQFSSVHRRTPSMMDGVIQDLQKAAAEHNLLKQSSIKTNETKKRVKALNKRCKILQAKVLLPP